MPKESFVKRYGLLIGTGLAVGAAAVLLTALGNPANMHCLFPAGHCRGLEFPEGRV